MSDILLKWPPCIDASCKRLSQFDADVLLEKAESCEADINVSSL